MDETIKIIRLLPDVTGVYIQAECENCKQEFKQYLPTIFGLGICTLTCPACSATSEIDPVRFLELIDNSVPSVVDHDVINETASGVAEKWYRVDEIAEALDYSGISLGEPAERFLVSIITNGILLSQTQDGDGWNAIFYFLIWKAPLACQLLRT